MDLLGTGSFRYFGRRSARHFSLIDGWGPSYPETTGYLVPTVLQCGDLFAGPEARERARRMLDWLLSIQYDSGAFRGGTIIDSPEVPVAFNTGQILIGLAAGAEAFGEPYADAMLRAARWLVEIQAPNGQWKSYQSPFARPGDKAYDAHSACGMFWASRVANDPSIAEAASLSVRWAVTKQAANGWISDCCLTDPGQPLTHTLGYALKGFVEAHRHSGDPSILAAARRTADGLMTAIDADGFLPGRLTRHWQGTVRWSCLTGSVQVALSLLELYQLTGCEAYLDRALKLNGYVRRTIDVSTPGPTRGGVRGSYPVSGDYGRFQYLNWAAKFFIDSNLLEQDLRRNNHVG